MKKQFLLIAFLLIGVLQGTAQLKIVSVNGWGAWQYGSIDSALVTVEPKGLYAEVGVYLDFSTRGTSYYDPIDSLEVQMNFELPKDVEVTDLWLWFNDSIIVADIYDKWTATQVYEDIVDRRTDPALLQRQPGYYNSNYRYDLRVFPLLTTMPRKIKMTFQVPIESLTDLTSSIDLPGNILSHSYMTLLSYKVQYIPGQNLDSPTIEGSNIFVPMQDSFGNTFYEADLTSGSFPFNVELDLVNNNTAQFFAGQYAAPAGQTDIFHLEISPKEIFQISNPKKVLFLIDFDESNTNSLTDSELYDELEDYVMDHFGLIDSINIMISGFITNDVGGDWVSGNSSDLNQLFSQFDSGDFNNNSNLQPLLIDGISFIQDHGNEGEIILISNDDSNGDLNSGNNLITNIIDLMGGNEIPINVIDLYDSYYPYYWIGGQYFRGNDYLYMTLTSQLNSQRLSIRDYSFEALFGTMHDYIGDYFTNLTVNSSSTGGFVYGEYNLSDNDGFLNADENIRLVGKMTGSFPMSINLIGELSDGTLHSNSLLINSADVHSLDSLAESVWVGQYLNELSTYTQTNNVTSQIINTSIEKRVLSDYTAFLALEPGVGPFEDDTPNPVNVAEFETNKLLDVKAYPNPANNIVTIEFEVDEASNIRLEIMDLSGRVVQYLEEESLFEGKHKKEISVKELPQGIYVLNIMKDGVVSGTVKLIVSH